MRKVKIAGVLLVSSLILILVGNFTIAQDSSYVGISEGDEYIWDVGLNKDGVESLKDDTEMLVQEILNNISTLDLGAYTDLNVSEAILLGCDNSFDLINEILPQDLIPDWKIVNISAFMENLVYNVVEIINSSGLSGAIPYDWKSRSIVDFFDHVIEGLNETIPGFENFTFVEIIDAVFSIIDDYLPFELVSEGWEDMAISNLIELILGYPINFINTTILPGLIPSDWLHMDLAPLLQNVFPILPQALIDQVNASFEYFAEIFGGYSIYTFFEMFVQSYNYSGQIPGNWDDYSLSELIFPFLFQGYEDYNISYTLDEFFEIWNSSTPFDLYSSSMSSLINMTIYDMTYYLPIEQKSAPIIDLFRDFISSMVWSINYTLGYSSDAFPVGTFPDGWMSLTIDNLRIYYVNQTQIWLDQLMVQVEDYLLQFELFGGFQRFSLKTIIDHIGDEIELIPGGPKGVPINISIEIKVPTSDWINLTDLIEFDIFQYYQIYILDPTTFSVDGGALLEQFLSTGALFIGKGYDWSDIVKEYEFPGPAPGKVLNFDIDWNNNGILDHVRIEYDGQEIASIELDRPPEPGIPGYNLLLFTGITLFSIGAVITSIKKKKAK